MILVDVNILLQAINSDAPRHAEARTWWDAQLSDGKPVCLAWATVLGFVRIATNPRIFPRPLTVEETSEYVDLWLSRPCVRLIEPVEGHWERVRDLLAQAGTAGNLTTDAHLAALAVEHGCEVCSTDADFSRFPGLRYRNPLLPSETTGQK